MQWLRILTLVIITSIGIAKPSLSSNASQKAALERKAAQEKLVKIAAAIQSHEAHLSAVEYELNQARTEENAILGELDHYNQRLMETVHYLRHATQCSPLLAMLSAPKPEDVIHSSLLLRSITPEIHARNQHLLEKVKTLSKIRAQLETKQNQLHDITFHYHQERENLDALLKNQPQTTVLIDENSQNNAEIFTLISPVAGELVPTYKSPNPEWAPFTQGVLFRTRHGAQVIAPLSGKIVFAGEYTEGQGKMVIIETQNSHVAISGLGSLNCQLGQNTIAGVPIGRMPAKTKASGKNTQQLYLEVWHQEQTIDPGTVLKIKEKISTN